ncbi:hypothetical protein HYALB_00013840 [Hymenoscyphus albidus]|uniref:Complex III subunit 9 n=1 Tax=Hymenoscyphus albidus TaxID=595503 RepID=A0A9N9QBC1_9HELO|nr:hypothetical protein HYALB_00013840 [Hymenoscyphus albidus]
MAQVCDRGSPELDGCLRFKIVRVVVATRLSWWGVDENRPDERKLELKPPTSRSRIKNNPPSPQVTFRRSHILHNGRRINDLQASHPHTPSSRDRLPRCHHRCYSQSANCFLHAALFSEGTLSSSAWSLAERSHLRCMGFDNTMDSIWDKFNKGRQWKDIRSKYVEAADDDE